MPSRSLPADQKQRSISTLLDRVHETRREMMRPVFEHPRDYVLMNIREFGNRLGVDPATISRTVVAMGFPGYREFQKYLHQLSSAHSTALDRMRATGSGPASLEDRVRETLHGATHNLESVCNSLDAGLLALLADKIYAARRIYVLAGDMAVSLGYFLHYQLMMLGFDVILAANSGHVMHQMNHATKSDLVVAISFRRGLRQTVEGVIQAHGKGCYIIGITDTSISPIARLADKSLLVPVDVPHFSASYVAPMAMLDALLSAVANRKRDRTMQRLKEIEKDQKSSYRWYPES